ncbi:hypothetical protein PAPYR_5323 [Paratrimastix pyriformis]|uniref:Uncharacterized protein n=1 Tax=Paratrimastix pyriformis TaxID=342808 RepID=A0ABQ8ULI4_9EUKA|nr:hypothetical protein PAPYR_5323 [Paratrimastix pyriformis]
MIDQDVPRFFPHTSILDESGADFLGRFPERPPQENIVSAMLILLSEVVQPERTGALRQAVMEHLHGRPEMMQAVTFGGWLDAFVDPVSPFRFFLKVWSQVFPHALIENLHTAIFAKFPFVDGGRWDIECRLPADPATGSVEVTHLKAMRTIAPLVRWTVRFQATFALDRALELPEGTAAAPAWESPRALMDRVAAAIREAPAAPPTAPLFVPPLARTSPAVLPSGPRRLRLIATRLSFEGFEWAPAAPEGDKKAFMALLRTADEDATPGGSTSPVPLLAHPE